MKILKIHDTTENSENTEYTENPYTSYICDKYINEKNTKTLHTESFELFHTQIKSDHKVFVKLIMGSEFLYVYDILIFSFENTQKIIYVKIKVC